MTARLKPRNGQRTKSSTGTVKHGSHVTASLPLSKHHHVKARNDVVQQFYLLLHVLLNHAACSSGNADIRSSMCMFGDGGQALIFMKSPLFASISRQNAILMHNKHKTGDTAKQFYLNLTYEVQKFTKR
jgi:hypothetical protein